MVEPNTFEIKVPIQFVVSATILVTTGTAVLCQFIQHTDEVFPLLYFTVDSSVFAGVVAGFTLAQPNRTGFGLLRAASAVAVMLSALIYAAVIAPASATGTWIQPHDDSWVRIATYLFHLVAPLVVTIDFLLCDARKVRWGRIIGVSYVWPMVYLAGSASMALSGVADVPYPFLDPSRMGWSVVSAAVLSLVGLIAVIATALWVLNRWLWCRCSS